MQPAQCVLLFLVLVGNSTLFRFRRSYSSRPFLCPLDESYATVVGQGTEWPCSLPQFGSRAERAAGGSHWEAAEGPNYCTLSVFQLPLFQLFFLFTSSPSPLLHTLLCPSFSSLASLSPLSPLPSLLIFPVSLSCILSSLSPSPLPPSW